MPVDWCLHNASWQFHHLWPDRLRGRVARDQRHDLQGLDPFAFPSPSFVTVPDVEYTWSSRYSPASSRVMGQIRLTLDMLLRQLHCMDFLRLGQPCCNASRTSDPNLEGVHPIVD